MTEKPWFPRPQKNGGWYIGTRVFGWNIADVAVCRDVLDPDDAALIAACHELREALEMVRDADDDCRRDGLGTMPRPARDKIDRALRLAGRNS